MSEASSEPDVAGNLAEVNSRIRAARRSAGLASDGTRLIAVGKGHGVEAMRAACMAGQRLFGENRVQEAAAKWPALRADFPDSELHLIGRLQSNKAAEAVALFDVIETLDRPKLARALAAAIGSVGRRPRLMVQVNTGEEPQKGGVRPHDLGDLLALARGELGLDISGLMCIPPQDDDPALHFALLRELARRHELPLISAGMSGDYEIAAAMGADFVRVGTAIFGPRG